VKLCHINRSGPLFLRRSVVSGVTKTLPKFQRDHLKRGTIKVGVGWLELAFSDQ